MDCAFPARMNSPIGMLRPLLIGVDLLMACVASACGMTLIAHPRDGLGLSLDLLRGSPFIDYMIPGFLLAGVIGGFYLIAGVLMWRRHSYAVLASGASGIALMIWIAVQVLLIPYHPMQPAMFAYGLTTAIIAAIAHWVEKRNGSAPNPSE